MSSAAEAQPWCTSTTGRRAPRADAGGCSTPRANGRGREARTQVRYRALRRLPRRRGAHLPGDAQPPPPAPRPRSACMSPVYAPAAGPSRNPNGNVRRRPPAPPARARPLDVIFLHGGNPPGARRRIDAERSRSIAARSHLRSLPSIRRRCSSDANASHAGAQLRLQDAAARMGDARRETRRALRGGVRGPRSRPRPRPAPHRRPWATTRGGGAAKRPPSSPTPATPRAPRVAELRSAGGARGRDRGRATRTALLRAQREGGVERRGLRRRKEDRRRGGTDATSRSGTTRRIRRSGGGERRTRPAKAGRR